MFGCDSSTKRLELGKFFQGNACCLRRQFLVWKQSQTAPSLFKNGATHQFCYKLLCHCCLKMKPHNNDVTNCSVIVWKWSHTPVLQQTALSLLFKNEATQQRWTYKLLCHCCLKIKPNNSSATNCSVIVVSKWSHACLHGYQLFCKHCLKMKPQNMSVMLPTALSLFLKMKSHNVFAPLICLTQYIYIYHK